MNIDVEQNGAVHSNPDPGEKMMMGQVLFKAIMKIQRGIDRESKTEAERQ